MTNGWQAGQVSKSVILRVALWHCSEKPKKPDGFGLRQMDPRNLKMTAKWQLSEPYVLRPLRSNSRLLDLPSWGPIVARSLPAPKFRRKSLRGHCGTFLLRETFQALTPEQKKAFVADFGEV